MTYINERITTKLQELLEESRQDLIQSIGTDGEEYATGVYEGIERALVIVNYELRKEKAK